MTDTGGYAAPATSGIEVSFNGPLEVTRWRPLVNWLIAIPHLVMLFIYGIGAAVFMIVAFFQVLFQGRVSESTHDFIVKVQRYSWRVSTFVNFMRDDSPTPYAPVGGAIDPGDDPARLSIPHGGDLNRWAVLYKWILAIPAAIVLWVYSIGALVFVVIAFFQVLFQGAWSQNGRDFVVKVHRQAVRIYAYVLLTDEKPPITPE